jgi:hypothetical protein
MLVATGCLGCAAGLSSRHDPAQLDRRDRDIQVQQQAALMRSELDSMRAALLEKDRREAELWQGYMALMARVNQLMEQQQRAQAAAEVTPISTQSTRPVAVRALLRAINRMNLTQEQRQSLIRLLSPPRTLDETNPWNGEVTW